MTRRTWTCATCRIERTCTLSLVSSFDSFHHTTWLKAARTCFSPSSHPCTCVVVFEFLSITFYFFLLFLFLFPFLMTDGDSMTINNLRDSANGTFVTLDDYLPLTERRELPSHPPSPPPPPPPFLSSLLPVCMLKTSPCVGSKRLRVCRQNAHVFQHAGVLLVHTEAF